MPRVASISSIKAQIAKQEKALEKARERQAHSLGMIALEAGFEDVTATERELRDAFRTAAARFRADEPKADAQDEGAIHSQNAAVGASAEVAGGRS